MARERPARGRRRRIFAAVSAIVVPLIVMGNVSPPRLSEGRYVAVERGRLPTLWPEFARTGVDHRLSGVASSLAWRHVEVRCWSVGDWNEHEADLARQQRRERYGPWSAYTDVDAATVHLGPGVCGGLAKLRSASKPVWATPFPDALAWSVAALAHEAQHATGELDEAETECRGMQTIADAAVQLGRTREEGRFLAETHWKHWYPWHPPEYRSLECRNGERLDIRPDTDAWP